MYFVYVYCRGSCRRTVFIVLLWGLIGEIQNISPEEQYIRFLPRIRLPHVFLKSYATYSKERQTQTNGTKP